jgi:lysophospholipid hydrolase
MADSSILPPGIAASDAASSIVQNSSRVAHNMSTTSLLGAATGTSPGQIGAQASGSWIGMLGRAILLLIRVIPGILYWLIAFTTITLPSFLFSLFSTSLTFTMNATTL